MSGVIAVCHRGHVQCSARLPQAAMQDALVLVTDKDWLLTVKKIGEHFEFEAKFGQDMASATLQDSIKWLAQTGSN
jgi:hypothetical protein